MESSSVAITVQPQHDNKHSSLAAPTVDMGMVPLSSVALNPTPPPSYVAPSTSMKAVDPQSMKTMKQAMHQVDNMKHALSHIKKKKKTKKAEKPIKIASKTKVTAAAVADIKGGYDSQEDREDEDSEKEEENSKSDSQHVQAENSIQKLVKGHYVTNGKGGLVLKDTWGVAPAYFQIDFCPTPRVITPDDVNVVFENVNFPERSEAPEHVKMDGLDFLSVKDKTERWRQKCMRRTLFAVLLLILIAVIVGLSVYYGYVKPHHIQL